MVIVRDFCICGNRRLGYFGDFGGIRNPPAVEDQSGTTHSELCGRAQGKERNADDGRFVFRHGGVLAYFFFAGRSGRISYVVIAIGIAYLIVGFLDDFIKIKNRHNLGLRAYQKILFQLAIGIIAGVFCYLNGLTVFYLPFSMRYFDFSYWTIPLVAGRSDRNDQTASI